MIEKFLSKIFRSYRRNDRIQLSAWLAWQSRLDYIHGRLFPLERNLQTQLLLRPVLLDWLRSSKLQRKERLLKRSRLFDIWLVWSETARQVLWSRMICDRLERERVKKIIVKWKIYSRCRYRQRKMGYCLAAASQRATMRRGLLGWKQLKLLRDRVRNPLLVGAWKVKRVLKMVSWRRWRGMVEMCQRLEVLSRWTAKSHFTLIKRKGYCSWVKLYLKSKSIRMILTTTAAIHNRFLRSQALDTWRKYIRNRKIHLGVTKLWKLVSNPASQKRIYFSKFRIATIQCDSIIASSVQPKLLKQIRFNLIQSLG